MNRIIAFFCLLVCGFVGSATSEEIPGVHLYFAAGVTSTPGSLTRYPPTPAEGLEFRMNKHFSLSGETGFLPNDESVDGTTAIRFSIGPSYHLARRFEQKLDPFLAGGITWRMYPGDYKSGVNHLAYFGGGINYWFSPRFGLKLDLRDHAWITKGTTLHFIDMRAGICIDLSVIK
jgi:hypothetical protein